MAEGPLPLDEVIIHKSFRVIQQPLWGLKCKKIKPNFKLERESERFCVHQGLLWMVCPKANVIDVYDLSGGLQRMFALPGVRKPNAIHPYTAQCLPLAADSGLYFYNTSSQSIGTTLERGCFTDVHLNDSKILALERKAQNYHQVHVFDLADPPVKTQSFTINQSILGSILLHKQHLYFSTTTQPIEPPW